jgi:hypothetical protein
MNLSLHQSLHRALLLLLAFALSFQPVLAQTIFGTINGTVTDSTGAVLPNVKIRLKNLDTGLVRETNTDSQGAYRIPSIQTGKYSIEYSVANFETVVRGPLTVDPQVIRTIDVSLKPGATTQVVTVQEEAPMIEATQAQLTKGVETRRILELPGNQNRDGLALLQPGVTPNNNGRPGSGFVVNGARSRSNNFMLDGANNNDQSLSIARQNVPPEFISQFRIITNGFSAEYGRNSGAVVNQITRSGTNEFHGIARYTWQGNGFNSLTTGQQRTFNAQKATGVSDYVALRRSRGVTVDNNMVLSGGGPIKKNHTFFFVGYDRNWFRTSASPSAITLSSAARSTLTGLRTSFAPGAVDALLRMYPESNDPTPRGQVTITNPVAGGAPIALPLTQVNPALNGALAYGTNFHRGLIKGDTRFGSKDTFSGRYLVDDEVDPGAPNAIPVNQQGSTTRNHSATGQHTRVWGPTSVMESRFTWSRRVAGFIENFPPQFSITGSSLPTLGNQNFPQFRRDDLFEAINQWSVTRGKHTLRFGGNYLRYDLFSFFAPASEGVITYTSMDNYLRDQGALFSRAQGDFITPAITHESAFYFQDDYKIRSNFTLNLGIRYEYTSAPLGFFSSAKADIDNFAPRFGFAWAPKGLGILSRDGKMSVRGGYAISYDQVFQNVLLNVSRNFPRVLQVNLSNLNGTRLYDGYFDQSRFPATPAPTDTAGIAAAGINTNTLAQRLYAPASRIRQPYSQQINFGVERQLGNNHALKVFYVGTRGINLVREVEQNLGFFNSAINANPSLYAPVIAGFSPVTVGGLGAVRREPNRGSILVGDGIGQSTYHSLQATFERRFAKRFQYELNYTWSSFINNADDVLGGQANRTLPSVPFNWGLDRARSGYDQPHRFVANYVYELPSYKNGTGMLGRVLGGYQISGITTMATGTPYSILSAVNALGILPGQVATVELSQRASVNLNGDRNIAPAPGVTNSYWILNPANSGIIGNAGANTERVGNTYNTNVALVKNTRVFGENHSIQMRWELTNLFNFRNFSTNPLNTISANTNNGLFKNLGQTNVTGRTMIFSLRYNF